MSESKLGSKTISQQVVAALACASFLAFGLLLPRLSLSQETLEEFKGENTTDRFGSAVALLGDLDGDGVPELAVGATYVDTPGGGDDSGRAYIISGATGLVNFTVDGDFAADILGGSIADAGDVNGDGTPDIIIGAMRGTDPGNGLQTGMVKVISGTDGSRIHAIYGIESSGRFGISVDGLGDINLDGYDDFIVGAKWENNPDVGNSKARGSAKMFSGLTGELLYVYWGSPHWRQIGFSVAGVGDINGDGHPDGAIGGRGGNIRLMSGADGTIFHIFSDDGAGTLLGVSVAGAGDVDGDGVPDIIAGAPNTVNERGVVGAAYVFSGADYTIIHSWEGENDGDYFGGTVNGAGDVDGDGNVDLLVAATKHDYNGDNAGSVTVFSGATGDTLFTVYGKNPEDNLGTSIASAGDYNNDGLSDILVGIPLDDSNGEDAGSVWLVVNECPGDPNKGVAGQCGCGLPDTDTDSDGTADCLDMCDSDPSKNIPGACGCGTADTDADGDGTADCEDQCISDPNKSTPGTCGCGIPDTDDDNDGVLDCFTTPQITLPAPQAPATETEAAALLTNTMSMLSVFHEKTSPSKKAIKANVGARFQVLRGFFRNASLPKQLKRRANKTLRIMKRWQKKRRAGRTKRAESKIRHLIHALNKIEQKKSN